MYNWNEIKQWKTRCYQCKYFDTLTGGCRYDKMPEKKCSLWEITSDKDRLLELGVIK